MVCSPKAVRALIKTKGLVIEVTDEEIIEALKDIIKKEFLTPEPTSATVYATLKKLHIDDKNEQKIVCIQTGNGMKHLDEIIEVISG